MLRCRCVLRGDLGTTRVDRNLVDDVSLRALPLLKNGYVTASAAEHGVIGEAPKDLIFLNGWDHAYIAKAPAPWKKCKTRAQVGPLECVTEYMISRIGNHLPVKLAGARLVRLRTRDGKHNDVRFMSRYFLRHGQEQLVHGIELVAHAFDIAPDELTRQIPPNQERDFYTVDMVNEVLEIYSRPSRELYYDLRNAFARMMAFDAIVGVNDRHPWNWGVVTNVVNRDTRPRFSPIYDTARGLFWNHSDDELRAKPLEKSVRDYADGSRPLIAHPGAGKRTHFDVIDYMVNGPMAGTFAASVRLIVGGFDADECRRCLHVEFRNLVSRDRLKYVEELLRYRHARLISICKRSS